jgi:branched-chain amino acid transport system substrate-binding protein
MSPRSATCPSSSISPIRRTRSSSRPSFAALKAAKPDIVYVASYPPDSAGILRAVNEIGIGDDVKVFGGGMVGLQFAAVMGNLGSLLNGVVNYNTWLPEPSMYHAGTKEFFDDLYQARHRGQGRSARLLSGAVRLCDGPDDRGGGQFHQVARPEGYRLNICARTSTRPSSGRSRFRLMASARKPATLQAQFRGREGQGHRTVPLLRPAGDPVPEQAETGDLISPFEAARK